MPRSRIFCTKSKWSRLALSTHMTSSNSKLSQLDGVSRWWARPGAQTMTLRSVPTSEWTPNGASSVTFSNVVMSITAFSQAGSPELGG
jgi:hypothetical protein